MGSLDNHPGSSPRNWIALQRARKAFAAADSQGADWLTIGDSVTEGTGAASTYRDNRYAGRLLKLLQKRYMAAGKGGAGYVACSSFPGGGTTQGSEAWTFSAHTINFTEDLSLYSVIVMAIDETATLTLTSATSIDVYMTGQSPFPTSVNYTLDGGSQQTLTFAARPTGYITYGPYKVGSITLGASGAHTVVFSPPAGTKMYPGGCFVYDGDEGKGIRLFPGGHYGITSTNYLATPGSSSILAIMAADLKIAPALVTIFLGLNDYSTNINPATFQSNIQSIIANVKTNFSNTPAFLLVAAYTRNDVSSPTYPWSQYIVACNTIAAADPNNVAVMSLNDRFSIPSSSNSYDNGMFNTDTVHPTSAGHYYIATALDAVLAPV